MITGVSCALVCASLSGNGFVTRSSDCSLERFAFVHLITPRFSEVDHHAHQDRNRFSGFFHEITRKTAEAVQNIVRQPASR
jgi:hypothetical protein